MSFLSRQTPSQFTLGSLPSRLVYRQSSLPSDAPAIRLSAKRRLT